ncbi:PQQ-dependent sugar dehydrogenase [Pseudolabrys taiwanensis]|uniref:PQQ-dependent sugar dehydrogenase n=1 Tax=Pseudolabrys taiwanensis TaxID=331696 RepID=A0A346A2A2_9HYPH|nr:PQQ-dependent sugar dehydrogenase [Pseudolabrys taiwanensis]AXK83299.1 PQQ-dependent sugar dehydrogenase [Pseudolabrys taiwanensis]
MRLAAALILALLSTAAQAADPTFDTSAGQVRVETVARGLDHPWSLAFLPDGRMLVTERPGRLRIVARDGALSPALEGVPKVFARSQAGLMDVILARDFAQSGTIFFCYAEAVSGGGRIAVARARLEQSATPRLADVTPIFHQKGPPSTGLNIGCRMAQAPDGNLFVTLGDHFAPKEDAQTLDNHIGKIVRITPDGKAPADNPFVGKPNALPEIWAYGLRNAQGLAFNPANGQVWEQEHGPMGGDEINIMVKGANYGWPQVSFGRNYDGTPVGTGKAHMDGVTDPIWHWTPSIAPSGMAFYTGDLFPAWKGSLFNGALKFALVSRLAMKDGKPAKEERMLQDLAERIRDVRQGPDGALYLLTDNSAGRILRMVPAQR